MKTADRHRVQNAILAVTCVVYTVLLLQALFFKLVSPGELFDIGGRVRAFNFILTFTITRLLRFAEKKLDGKDNYTIFGSQTDVDAEIHIKKEAE